MKWSWAGHINRLKDDRWTSRVTTWRPYDKKRRQGRPAKRWRDDLDKYWSVRNMKSEFRTFLEITDPDIIMGTETWLSPTDFCSEYFPEQYVVYRTDRCTTGGGVQLGIKTRLMSQQVVTPPDVELVMATFTVTKRLAVLIGCCYRPPNTTEE